jgi:hypothetical protein
MMKVGLIKKTVNYRNKSDIVDKYIFFMEIHIKKISKLNKILMYCLPIGMSLASLVSGYFMVYLTMIEDEICVYNGISAEYIDIEFTLITAALPLGAIVGN